MSGNHRQSSAGTRRASAYSDARHDAAVLQAEVKRLVRALAPHGVLRRDALRREVGADNWHDRWFERALDAAVTQGQIEVLPLGFYGLRHRHRSRA
jgi:hypothetical protein